VQQNNRITKARNHEKNSRPTTDSTHSPDFRGFVLSCFNFPQTIAWRGIAAALPMSVYLLATLDTKGREAEFLRARLRACGAAVTLVDTGALGTPDCTADSSSPSIMRPAASRAFLPSAGRPARRSAPP
jgi:Uncharacterised protein family (UPF0261)